MCKELTCFEGHLCAVCVSIGYIVFVFLHGMRKCNILMSQLRDWSSGKWAGSHDIASGETVLVSLSDVKVLLPTTHLVCLCPSCLLVFTEYTAEWLSRSTSEDSSESLLSCVRTIVSKLRGSPGLSIQPRLPPTQDGWERISDSHPGIALGTLKGAFATLLPLLCCDGPSWTL